MTNPKFNSIVTAMEDGSLTVSVVNLSTGEVHAAGTGHANLDKILARLGSLDEDALALFDVAKAVSIDFAKLSDRVTLRADNLYLDGDPVDSRLAGLIEETVAADGKYGHLVNFLEKLETNPNDNSREQLFGFVEKNGIVINEDGDLVLYKGVNSDNNGGYESINSGRAFVDGREVNGKIPAGWGQEITMPRSEVSDDPYTACHVGLHAGAWEYASTFGQTTLTVVVNPRDVVAVPNDYSRQKMRVCRYIIQDVQEGQHGSVFWTSSDEEDDDYLGYSEADYGTRY